MRKILTLFKREYRAAVRTRSFIISLVMVPLFMAGGFIAVIITEKKTDTEGKKFVVIDQSGFMEEPLKVALEQRNENEIFNTETGEQNAPVYTLEFEEADTVNPLDQQLALSDRIKSGELHAFIEIGPGILHPSQQPGAFLKYYTEHSFNDQSRYWFRGVVNDKLRELRAKQLNLDQQQTSDLLSWIEVEGLGLASVDKRTGKQQEAQQSDELQSFIVPYALVMLMFMLAMMSAIPLLSAVMEEKNEKIAEVLLGSITPFQFMMGKVLGGVGVSLTTAAIYVAAAVFTLNSLDIKSVIPYEVLPWFFVLTVLLILMVGSWMSALGATCNDNKDAQSLTFPAILPVIIPIIIIVPIISDPNGALATTLSLIPPFTPTIMIVRLGTQVSIPSWQPFVGLTGVILFTIFTVWIGARIFRTAILIQGQKPSFANLFRYAFKT